MSFDEMQEQKVNLRVGPPPSESPPKQIDKYELREELSSGPSGVLHKAVNTTTGAVVALKVLKLPPSSAGGFKKRLKLEVETATLLAHPSIVPVVEYGETPEGLPYLVTEFVDDPTLFDVVHSKGNLQLTAVLGYFIGACEALAHAHSQGVVHRKVSGEKIFVVDCGEVGEQVRVSGFGSGWIGDGRKADPRADVFAFGMMMEDCFVGKAISLDMENIISFCISDHPSERYADCGEVLRNLLLLNQGKMPEPPKDRPGQSWMKPPVVAAVIVAAIVLTSFTCVQLGVLKPPSATTLIVKPAVNAVKTAIGEEFEKQPELQLTPEQARQKYGLNDETASTATHHAISKEKIKSTATTAAIIGAAAYQGLSPEKKEKAQAATMKTAAKGIKKWQAMPAEKKTVLQTKAAGFASKAVGLWSKLPSR